MAELNPPQFLQQRNDHTAQGDRLSLGGLFLRGGIRDVSDLTVSAQSTPNMTVSVGRGHAYVAGTQDTNQGYYHCYNDGVITKTIGASSPTQSRIDLVVARVQDAFYSGAVNAWDVFVVAGTPGTPGARPSVPANCEELGQITIGTNATTITSTNISRTAKIMALKGSVVPVASQTERDTIPVFPGLVVFRNDTDTLEFYDGAAWKTQGRNATRVRYDGNNTWLKPVGVKQVRVCCVGGGGGSGGIGATTGTEAAQSGGGGGGGYAEKWLDASILGATVTVTVGTGGAGGATGVHAGATGGSSSFGSFCVAPGGTGGATMDGAAGFARAIGGIGGTPTVGDVLVTGQQGGFGTVRSGGAYGNNFGGVAGGLGGGGTQGDVFAGPGVAGTLYGGGAAGAVSDVTSSGAAGGAGARGVVIVEHYF
jgi:hypothetical protein